MATNQKKDEFLFFFGRDGLLSNWNIKWFEIKGVKFNCIEQAMMFMKAKFFHDEITAELIMQTQDPAEHKRLGRLVVNYNDEAWNARRDNLVFIACLAKARQNPVVKAYLISTGDRELVEASKFDRIWGIGLAIDDPRIYDRNQWRGENRLGKVQMRVRDVVKNE